MKKMISRLCTAVMMVMLLCSLTIMSASAANEGPACDGNHDGWTAITAGGTYKDEEGTNYCLTGNLTLTETITIDTAGHTVKLCMCGHNITSGKHIALTGGGKVQLVNCETTGGAISTTAAYGIIASITNRCDLDIGANIAISNTNADAKAILMQYSSVVNMYGGTITGTSTGEDKNGAGVSISSGTFNMYDGTITGKTAANGGGVYMGSGTFNMYGGTITGCSAAAGAGVYVDKGTFNMKGGTITNNSLASGKSDGGSVYLAAGAFNLTDGVVSGTSNHVYGVSTSVITISGGTVTGGSLVTGGADATLNIEDGADITANVNNFGTTNIRGGTITGNVKASKVAVYITGGNVTGTLTKVAENNPVFEISGGRFVNDPSAYVVDGKSVIADTSVSPYQYRVDDSVVIGKWPDHTNWTAVTKGTTISADGFYYLNAATVSGQINIKAGNVTLCMCGHDLTSASQTIVISSGSLTLVNCKETGGNISHTGTYRAIAISGGAVVTMKDNIHLTETTTGQEAVFIDVGTFNMEGGSITNNTGSAAGAVRVYSAGSAFNMSGGEISKNTATGNGGGVYVKSGTFTMTGGTISGNNAASGGGVYVDGGTFNMEGGEISGNTATSGGAGVYVNSGTFNMSGETARIAGDNAQLVYVAYSGSLNMTNGTITGKGSNMVYVISITDKDSKITGGTINGQLTQAKTGRKLTLGGSLIVNGPVADYGNLYITGGTYNGDVKAYGDTETDDIVISGGKINGKLVEAVNSKTNVEYPGSFVISGGQFSADTTREALEGYTDLVVADVEDGSYIYKVCADGFYTSGEHMNFESSLALGLYLNKSAEGYSINTSDGSPVVEMIAEGTYAFFAEGIAARDMDKEITYTIENSAGEVVFRKTASVYEAAQKWLADSETKDDTLVTDMINYGIEAQKVFREEAPMETLGSTDTTPRWTAIESGHGVNAGHENDVAVTLSLKDQIELNIYVHDVVTVSEGSTDGYTVEALDGGITRISYKDINVVDAANVVKMIADNGAEVTFSITDYCVLAKDGAQSELINALMKYIESVYLYMGKN